MLSTIAAIGSPRAAPSPRLARYLAGFPRGGSELQALASLSRVIFGLAGAALIALAALLIGYGAVQVLASKDRFDFALLDGLGYVVIAIAVFDVAKYLIEEEVIREREIRRAGEARQSLTRFTATIVIVVLLEAIVLIFKAAREQVSDLVYPTMLLLSGVAMIVGLGVYQRLSVTVEREAGEETKGPRPRT